MNNYLQNIAIKEKERQKVFIVDQSDYRKLNEKELENFIIKKTW